MAADQPIGEFTLKSTSLTISAGPAGSTVIKANFEGSAGALGVVIGTGAFIGAKNGTYSWTAIAYLGNGEAMTGGGPGTFESIGNHHWKTQGVLHMSNGQTLTTEGEIDLATRSWNGKIFAK
jgi:hypothetical protein